MGNRTVPPLSSKTGEGIGDGAWSNFPRSKSKRQRGRQYCMTAAVFTSESHRGARSWVFRFQLDGKRRDRASDPTLIFRSRRRAARQQSTESSATRGYLSPHSEKLRLTAQLLREIRDIYLARRLLTTRCWVPRSLAQEWFERRGIPWPKLFDPIAASASPRGGVDTRTGASGLTAAAERGGQAPKVRRRPGPKPLARKRIIAKMLSDLSSRRRTLEQLNQDTLEALKTQYGGSPNTAGEARKEALRGFAEFQKSKVDANSEEL